MIKSHVLYQLSYGPELVCKLTQILRTLEKKDNLISNTRLFSQKIAATEFKTAKEIVSCMGAVQAQDYAMAKWAVGLRLSDSTDEMVESSFNKGEIIRIHALRPTWHFVSPDDIYWIINLTAHKILSSLKSRHKQLELSESVIIKSTTLIEKELGKGISFYPITFPITTVAGTFAVLFTLSAPGNANNCLLYTSPSPRDGLLSRMPSSA